ncbi:hypothetical protein F5144DRAFT_499091, partial [Chaetomium tenue]
CHYTSAYRCKTCQATFLWEIDLRKHFDASYKCIARSDSFGPSGKGFTYSINRTDWDTINDVAGRRTMSPEDRWEGIWHVLFPERPAPPSPYAETDFTSGDLFLFCHHLISAGSHELSDFFKRENLCGNKIPKAAISKFLKSFCRPRSLALNPFHQLPFIPGVVDMGIDVDLQDVPLATSNQSADLGAMEHTAFRDASSKIADFGEQIVGNTARLNADSDVNGDGTGSLDSFEFGDILVPDGSRFSSAQSAAVRALTVAYDYERESQIVTPYGTTGAVSDPTDGPGSSSPQNTPSDSAGSLASFDIHSLLAGITSQISSQRGDARQKRGREEDDEPKKSPPQKRKRIENGAKRFACPFQKRYPLKHFFCGAGGAKGETRGFVHISHIKSHIHRCHTRPLLYCPNCKEEFEDPEGFAEHLRGQSCEAQPFRDETALPWTAALAASLRAGVDKAQSLSGQWFSIWRILFPEEREPSSCFVDDVPEHMLQFQQFIARRGDEIVRDVIHTHGLLSDRESAADEDPECAQQNEEELVAFARRVFGLATEAIFQSFTDDAHQAHQASPSGEQSRQGNDTPRNKGKAPENYRTASNSSDQTNDGIPVITESMLAVFTPSAVQRVPDGTFIDQGAGEVEDNNLTASDPIQPVATTGAVLHGSSLPSLEMALDHPGRGEGIAEGSGSFGGGGTDNAGITLEEDFMHLFGTSGGDFGFLDPTTFGPGGSDSGTNPPPR